jgi:hypothetical protein
VGERKWNERENDGGLGREGTAGRVLREEISLRVREGQKFVLVATE